MNRNAKLLFVVFVLLTQPMRWPTNQHTFLKHTDQFLQSLVFYLCLGSLLRDIYSPDKSLMEDRSILRRDLKSRAEERAEKRAEERAEKSRADRSRAETKSVEPDRREGIVWEEMFALFMLCLYLTCCDFQKAVASVFSKTCVKPLIFTGIKFCVFLS